MLFTDHRAGTNILITGILLLGNQDDDAKCSLKQTFEHCFRTGQEKKKGNIKNLVRVVPGA